MCLIYIIISRRWRLSTNSMTQLEGFSINDMTESSCTMIKSFRSVAISFKVVNKPKIMFPSQCLVVSFSVGRSRQSGEFLQGCRIHRARKIFLISPNQESRLSDPVDRLWSSSRRYGKIVDSEWCVLMHAFNSHFSGQLFYFFKKNPLFQSQQWVLV